MASVDETSSDSSEISDLASVHQLVSSVGQLKFSLRAVASMQLQTALLCQTDSEPIPRAQPLESNQILENIIGEIFSRKCEENSDHAKSVDGKETSLSIADLEVIQKRLQEELEERKSRFVSSMSSRFKE